MEDIIEYYINENSLYSINAFTGLRKTIANFVNTYYPDNNRVNSILSTIFYEDWIYQTGPDPTGLLDFNNVDCENAVNLATEYISLGGVSSPSGFEAYHTWSGNQ